MPDADMNNEMTQIFKQEAGKNLTVITNLLLELEKKGVDPEKLNQIKVKAHTLKGDARMMGFKSISNAAHSLEDLFEVLVRNVELTNAKLYKNIYEIVDIIEDAVRKLPQQISIEISRFLPDLRQEAKPEKSADIEIFTDEPEPDKIEQKKSIEKNPDTREEYGKSIQKEYIQVGLDKVEDFLNLSSRITEYYGRFEYLYQKLQLLNMDMNAISVYEEFQNKIDTILYDFSHQLAFYNMLARQFQEEITKLKLVPLSTIFEYFPRLVRDVAESTGKKVDFIIHGGTVELDRIIVGKLKDILIHILRNAVDHGCEPEDKRKQAGKPLENKVVLKAYNRGDMVLIEVSDDGSGLDIAKIKENATKKGLIPATEAGKLRDEEVINFIFKEGFSTRDVGTFSGRGIGMDAVAKIIKELNGDIDVLNNPCRGTSFIISVPLISSFIPLTLFNVNKTLFAIPSSYIVAALHVNTDSINHVSDKTSAVHINNMDVIIVDLASFFNINSYPKENDRQYKNIIIISHQDEITGLVVSNVIMEKKMIIEKPGALGEKMPLILGAVMGSDHAVPVLNVPFLFEKLKTNMESSVVTKREKTGSLDHKLWQKKVLLVEDSLVTRLQEKDLLQQQKIYVLEAANGQEAVSLLKREIVDLIITDIEMPVMNGIELVKFLKKDSEYSRIPVVVVSSYTSYFGQMSELGVKYFVDKGDFKSFKMIEILKQENLI